MSRRVLFLVPAGLALVVGLDAGLRLLGLPSVHLTQRLPEVPGVLQVSR